MHVPPCLLYSDYHYHYPYHSHIAGLKGEVLRPRTRTSAEMSKEGRTGEYDAALKRYSGIWTRIRFENIEELIAAQGGSYFVRKIAVNSKVVHVFRLTFNLEEAPVITLEDQGTLLHGRSPKQARRLDKLYHIWTLTMVGHCTL